MPSYMKLGDIRGEAAASPAVEIFAYDKAFIGGVRVPSGDDVVVDGRIITAENWDAAVIVPVTGMAGAGVDPF